MPKPEWGVKRTCPHCETRFYDLQKEPIVCPECGTTYDVDAHGKVSVTRERRAVPAGAADEEDLVDEEDLAEDEEDEAEDEALIGEDEDEEDEKAGPALSDEDADEDEKAFKDPDLVDEDEDEDDIDLDEDEDEDIDLDELPDEDKH